MPISRSTFPKLLEEGLDLVFGLEYARLQDEWKEIFEQHTSDKAFEEDAMITGFSVAVVKPEGDRVRYDQPLAGPSARYVHETYALAFAITEEAEEDGLYGKLGAKYSRAQARSMKEAKELKAASILNNGFDPNYKGADGKPLLAADHPLLGGGTASNVLATPADLDEASLEDAWIGISRFTDDRRIPIAARPRKLVISPENMFNAERLLRSTLRPGTGDNDVNVINRMGMFPGGVVVNHRLTDSDAWIVLTDVPNGLKHFKRVGLSTRIEGDFETGTMRYRARERYSFGYTDWRAAYGSSGV